MKLSFSTNAFVDFSVFAAVECIAACGYAGVEILADAPHFFATAVQDEDVRRLRDILRIGNIAAANINGNTAVGYYGRKFWEPLFEPSLANPDQAARDWRIAYTKKCLDIAEALACPTISITSGRMVPGVEPERSLEILLQSLETVLEYAEKRGIRIGMEYEPGLLVETCDDLFSLMEKVGSSSFGANLDLGHSFVLGEDVAGVIERLSDRIFHVHLEDIRAGKHFHRIPGTGDMDFGALLGALARVGYDGFVTVELYSYPQMAEEAARQAQAFLRKYSYWEEREKKQCA